MSKIWVWGIGVALMVVLGAGSGCVSLDKYQALDRSHQVLAEERDRVAKDLQDAQLQLRQKDAEIALLKKERNDLRDTVASLQAENESLRKHLAGVEGILKGAVDRGPGDVTIIAQGGPLPAAVNDALEKLVKQFPDLLEFDKAKGAVRWKADLLFPMGSDQMSASSEVAEAMKKFVEIINMAEAANLDVIVVGHTCTTPIRKAETLARFKDNWYLSAGRAIAVMQVFHGDGVDYKRLGVMGYGEHRPIADNATTEGKAKNRRVEVYLVPRESVQSLSSNGAEGKGLYQVENSNLSFAKVN